MKRLLLALLIPVVARAAAPVTTGPVTEMSPFEVRAASVEFKHWIKVGSPHFVLYTDATERDASTTLRELEMLHFAGQVVFGRKAANLGPVMVILPTASSDWCKLEAKGGVEWKSAATGIGNFLTNAMVIQYDWQEQGMGTARSVYSFIDMQRMAISGPFWFTRGFGMFYETADFDGDQVILGHVNPRIWGLKHEGWLPWDRFFLVNPRSPEFTKENKVGQYEAQAAVFTQYLFTHSDRAWIEKLVAWIDYLRTGGAPTEAAFKGIFGEDWKGWQATMEAYMETGRYSIYQVNTPAAVNHFTETKFKLSVKEMRELFVLVQVLVQDVPESRVSLDALLAHGLESDALRELLAEACLRWGRRDAALKLVRQLIAEGSTNPRVYRQGDALLTAYGGPLSLDLRYGPELAEVRDWDRRGLELEPLYSELNNSFASNEAAAPIVDQQSITTIEECYGRLKGRAPTDHVIMALAIALWRSGDLRTASELATRLANDPTVGKHYRKMASALIDRIKLTPPPATPAKG